MAAQTMLSSETAFGRSPRLNMLLEKNCAQTVLRDFNGRRAEGSLLMVMEQTAGWREVNRAGGVVSKSLHAVICI